MVYVVLCPGAPKSSTCRGSGSKNISEDGATAYRLIRQTGKARDQIWDPFATGSGSGLKCLRK